MYFTMTVKNQCTPFPLSERMVHVVAELLLWNTYNFVFSVFSHLAEVPVLILYLPLRNFHSAKEYWVPLLYVVLYNLEQVNSRFKQVINYKIFSKFSLKYYTKTSNDLTYVSTSQLHSDVFMSRRDSVPNNNVNDTNITRIICLNFVFKTL